MAARTRRASKSTLAKQWEIESWTNGFLEESPRGYSSTAGLTWKRLGQICLLVTRQMQNASEEKWGKFWLRSCRFVRHNDKVVGNLMRCQGCKTACVSEYLVPLQKAVGKASAHPGKSVSSASLSIFPSTNLSFISNSLIMSALQLPILPMEILFRFASSLGHAILLPLFDSRVNNWPRPIWPRPIPRETVEFHTGLMAVPTFWLLMVQKSFRNRGGFEFFETKFSQGFYLSQLVPKISFNSIYQVFLYENKEGSIHHLGLDGNQNPPFDAGDPGSTAVCVPWSLYTINR